MKLQKIGKLLKMKSHTIYEQRGVSMGKRLLSILTGFILIMGSGCGPLKESKTVVEKQAPNPNTDPGIDICKDQIVWDKVVKPITDRACLSCHAGMAGYDGAVNFIQVAEKGGKNGLRRIFGGSGSVMPPQNSGQSLNETEKQTIQTWMNEGFKKTCNGAGTGVGGYFTFDDAENIMLQFLEKQDKEGRVNTRFLVGTNNVNNPETKINSDQLAGAATKSLNQLSNERDIYKAIPIGGGIYAFELKDIGLTGRDWDIIVNADPFQFESFTTKGQTIKDQTGAKRPWIHLDNFLNVSHTDPVYSQLKRIPNTLDAFWKLVQVDINENYRDFEAHLIGVQQSEISPEDKDRLLERLEGDEGFCWATHDNSVKDLNNPATDVSLFPLTIQTGSDRVFLTGAQEFICQQKNGQFIYALFNGNGVRQDFAPLDVVVNTKAAGKRLDPTIRNARECSRCHNEGIIAAKDSVRNSAGFNFLVAESLQMAREPICIGRDCQVKIDPSKCYDAYNREIACKIPEKPVDQPGICRDSWGNQITCTANRDPNKCYNESGHVIKCGTDKPGQPGKVSFGQLDAKDRELVEVFYKTNDINETVFKTDNSKYQKSLSELGIQPNLDDPINVVADNFRVDADINEFCARVFLQLDECKKRINQSAILRAQLGPLLTENGVINLPKLIELKDVIIKELRLFVDRIDQ